MSTFWLRARVSRRSSGPSKPSTVHHQRLIVGEDGGAIRNRRNSRPVRVMLPLPAGRPGALRRRRDRNCCRRRQMGERMLAALERWTLQFFHFRRHVLHFVHVAIAVEHQIAAREKGRFGAHRQGPVQRLHGEVVRHQKPVKSYLTAYHIPNDFGAGGRRPLWINRLIDHMRGHRDGAGVKAAEGHEIAGAKVPPRWPSPAAASRWLSAPARPWPGICFITGSTPPSIRPSIWALPRVDHGGGIGGKGAVADHVMGARNRHVQHRQAIDIDPQAGEVMGDQAGIEIDGLAGRFGIDGMKRAEAGGRRTRMPVRRLQPGHPARLPGRSGLGRLCRRPCRAIPEPVL